MIIDTPGINNLIPMSEDERVTRDILLEPGDLKVIQVGDAKNIRRGLMITLQLAEMEKPVVLVLNMADEARERGITINAGGLAGILDIPVHLTIATRQKGLDAIIRSLNLGGERIPQTKLIYPEDFEESITQIEELFPPKHMGKRALALMLLSGDESLKGLLHTLLSESAVQRIEEIVHRLQRQYSTPLGVLINQKRLQAVDRILKGVFRKERWSGDTVHHRSLSDLTMHPIWGIPILLLVIYLLYKIVGDLGAGVGVQTMEKVVFGQFINPAVGWAVERFIPWKFWQDLLIGSYGLETMGLTYALAIVLPIVGAFFLAFGLLEDSGYLPRLAVMVNRIFKTMGLNGKAVLPMVLGLGCDTMATLTTRVLETKKERILVTLLLALGVPCSAQIGVMVGMFAKMSLGAIMVWGWVIVGSMILVGLLATKLIQGEKADFILEVPPLRIPTLGNILIKTLARLEWFVREAVPLFLLGTLLLFFLDRWGLLQTIQNWGAPIVVRFLGLPAKTTEVFLLGFVRRDYGAAGLYMIWYSKYSIITLMY